MQSFIGWVGGKRQLSKEIISYFPAEDIDRYIEVFGGAGWVLFAKEHPSGQMEVFNDVNGDLINLFRCVKYHCGALQAELDWLLHSREQFFDFMAQLAAPGLTDLQRAARYLYLVKHSFGSRQDTFATNAKNALSVQQYLPKVQERLRQVIIEHRDFEPLISTYDRPNALFYLDPPYVGTESYYKVPFDVGRIIGGWRQRLKISRANLYCPMVMIRWCVSFIAAIISITPAGQTIWRERLKTKLLQR